MFHNETTVQMASHNAPKHEKGNTKYNINMLLTPLAVF